MDAEIGHVMALAPSQAISEAGKILAADLPREAAGTNESNNRISQP